MDWSIFISALTAIDWNKLANIAVVFSAVFLTWQLIEMRRTTQAYSVAREILQDETVRGARKTVFQLGKEAKELDKWNKADINAAEIVCHIVPDPPRHVL